MTGDMLVLTGIGVVYILLFFCRSLLRSEELV